MVLASAAAPLNVSNSASPVETKDSKTPVLAPVSRICTADTVPSVVSPPVPEVPLASEASPSLDN